MYAYGVLKGTAHPADRDLHRFAAMARQLPAFAPSVPAIQRLESVFTSTGAWAVELSVPFSAVTGRPPVAGTEWRVNFCRIDRPSRDGALPRELSAWSPPGRANFHTQERFGVVEFGDHANLT